MFIYVILTFILIILSIFLFLGICQCTLPPAKLKKVFLKDCKFMQVKHKIWFVPFILSLIVPITIGWYITEPFKRLKLNN